MPADRPSSPSALFSLEGILWPALLYGPNRRIIAANGLAEALAGRALAGAYVATLTGLLHVRRTDCSYVVLPEMPAIRALAGEEVVDLPVSISAANGRRTVILVSSSLVREDGKIVGALSIWRDSSHPDDPPGGDW